MTSRSYSLFFYGTLMSPEVLYRVIYGLTSSPPANKLRIRPAILHDHERHRVLGVDYPGMVPRPGKSVRGTLVENLTVANVNRLDAFEGDEYERRDVKVTTIDGEEIVPTATYIWIASEDRLAKEEWNFEEFVREKLSRWTGRSPEFNDSDSYTDSYSDNSDAVATGGRHAWNGEVVRSAI